jgi:hypothetical protein
MTEEVDVQFGDIQRKEEKNLLEKPENTILICSNISSFK